jgi:hypothetical protein
MTDLDFLRFKEFAVDVAATVNSNGSGGWEVSLTQGGATVILTSQQLERINIKIQDYINQGIRT